MCFGSGGKSTKEVNADIQMNRENMASNERMAALQVQAASTIANANLEAGKAAANAQIQASKNAALGGVLGAALGAHTTHEEIKQWLPSEVGAETIRSYELAQKWNTTMEMKKQGFQDVAIDYELTRKSWKTLFSDPQWNSLKMADQTKQEMMTNARIFGVQSASNPGGVPLSKDYWMKLNSFKSPDELLKVDPAVAAQRTKQFNDWEAQMRASGKGMIVDIFKNPQLGGSSILTMKGKDPLLDPALAPLLGTMMKSGSQGTLGTAAVDLVYVRDDGQGGKTNTPQRGKTNTPQPGWHLQTPGTPAIPGTPADTTDWDAVIRAMTQGEKNPMTDQINELMKNGVVDKYGMINAGELMKYIPPELTKAPEFNMFKQLSKDESIRLADQYDQYSQMVIDPKLISEQNVGFGVTRRTKLNPDGTIAATAMEGMMTDMMGNPQYVSMQGTRLQEFYNRQSMILGPGGLFVPMQAPVVDEELSGRFEPGFWHQNQFAKPSQGMSGQPGESKPAQKVQIQNSLYNEGPSSGAAPGMQSAPPAAEGEGGGKTSQAPTAGTLGAGLVKQSSMPAGYEGAPLAAGG